MKKSNPADYFIRILAIDPADPEISRERCSRLTDAFLNSEQNRSIQVSFGGENDLDLY